MENGKWEMEDGGMEKENGKRKGLCLFLLLLGMKKSVFKLLALINKAILPKYYKRDLKSLKKWEMAIVGYKYWVTTNALG
jgi:hypothetical protein